MIIKCVSSRTDLVSLETCRQPKPPFCRRNIFSGVVFPNDIRLEAISEAINCSGSLPRPLNILTSLRNGPIQHLAVPILQFVHFVVRHHLRIYVARVQLVYSCLLLLALQIIRSYLRSCVWGGGCFLAQSQFGFF